MYLSFMISMAARCSDVCGWGQDSFPAGEIETRMESVSHLYTVQRTLYQQEATADCHHTPGGYGIHSTCSTRSIVINPWCNLPNPHLPTCSSHPPTAPPTLPTSLTNQQQRCVHHSRAIEHGGHEDVVARTVHKGDMSKQLESSTTAHSVTGEGVGGGAATRPVVGRPRTPLIVTPVHL